MRAGQAGMRALSEFSIRRALAGTPGRKATPVRCSVERRIARPERSVSRQTDQRFNCRLTFEALRKSCPESCAWLQFPSRKPELKPKTLTCEDVSRYAGADLF